MISKRSLPDAAPAVGGGLVGAGDVDAGGIAAAGVAGSVGGATFAGGGGTVVGAGGVPAGWDAAGSALDDGAGLREDIRNQIATIATTPSTPNNSHFLLLLGSSCRTIDPKATDARSARGRRSSRGGGAGRAG
jgi:hypothetical protein